MNSKCAGSFEAVIDTVAWEICDLCTNKPSINIGYLEIHVIQSMLPAAFVNYHRTSYKQHGTGCNSLWEAILFIKSNLLIAQCNFIFAP